MQGNTRAYQNSKINEVPKVAAFFSQLFKQTEWRSLRLATKGLQVEVVFSMSWTNTLEVGDVASNLLDGFNLLVQEVTLNEVGHLCIENIR